jgi:hypothetical protein
MYMTRIGLLIRIVSITIVTIFLIACITAGVFWWMDNYAPAPIREKLFYCYDFGQDLCAAARYYCWPAPPSGSCVKCNKVKYVQRYLRNEKVHKIVFGKREFVEPEKINRVLQLISSAKKELRAVSPWWGGMSIITDKHKFIIPIEFGYKTIYGSDWASEELNKQLWEWGYGEVYKYDLPSKEQTVAILLYPHHYKTVHPLAIFGDKKLAKEIMFGIWIRDKKDREGKIIRIGFNKYAEEFKPEKVFEGRNWLEKIMDAYENALKEAKVKERYYPMGLDNPVGEIVFMTQDWSYGREIGIDANSVFDDYIKSEQLKAYFDELGLTKELSAEEPNARH